MRRLSRSVARAPAVCWLQLLGCAGLLAGCHQLAETPDLGPSSLVVRVADGRTGCVEGDGLLPFRHTLTVGIQALGEDGAIFPHDGEVSFRMAPGTLVNPNMSALMLKGSTGPVDVPVELGFGGRARLWAELVDGYPGLPVGVSQELCFDTPSIRDVQKPTDSSYRGTSRTPFAGQQVTLRNPHLVATAVTTKGFFVTDLSPPGEGEESGWDSLFIFTFSNPTGVRMGSRICEVSGAVKEFLGFTELVFPTWRVYHPLGRAGAEQELSRLLDDDEVPDPRDDESIIFDACDVDDPSLSPEEVLAQAPTWLLQQGDIPPLEWGFSSDPRHQQLDRLEAAVVAIEDLWLPRRFENCDALGNRNGQVDRCYESSCFALKEAPEQLQACLCEDQGCGTLPPGCECSCSQVKETLCERSCLSGEPASLGLCAEESGYLEFGQWASAVGDPATGPRINVMTRDAIPDFDPTIPAEQRPEAFRSERLACVRGNLKQVNAAIPVWVVIPRNADDIVFADPNSPLDENNPCNTGIPVPGASP